jgi:transcriptional regulator with XRE-family HTH domain
MGRQVDQSTIEEWRQYYRRLVKESSNKEIAAKLNVDPGYLSRIARGAKNPGPNFLKTFYMLYPRIHLYDRSENDSISNDSVNKIPDIDVTMAEMQKQSVLSQEAMISFHSKMVDAYRDMTQTIRLLAETNREQFLELRRMKDIIEGNK